MAEPKRTLLIDGYRPSGAGKILGRNAQSGRSSAAEKPLKLPKTTSAIKVTRKK